jgi:hypothetical protein
MEKITENNKVIADEIKVGDSWVDVIHVKVKILEVNTDYPEIRYLCEKIGRGSQCWRTAKELSIKLPFGI